MTDYGKSFFDIDIFWHPDFEEGLLIAEPARRQFRLRIFENVSGSIAVSVIYRFAPSQGAAVSLPINLGEAETTTSVILVGSSLTQDRAWAEYVYELVDQTEESGLRTSVFHVSIETEAMAALDLAEQSFLWDKWAGSTEQRQQKLFRQLTYELCRMMRHYPQRLRHLAKAENALARYLPLKRSTTHAI